MADEVTRGILVLMFDIDSFVAACRAARHEVDAPERIAALLAKIVEDPAAIEEAVEKRRAGKRAGEMAEVFASDDDLTIYQLSFPSNLFGAPHDHAGWAVIGVYSGVEAFNLYTEAKGALAKTGRQVLRAPEVAVLRADLIHDIDNPGGVASGSIHVYSNRHFDLPSRRIWRDESALPEPFTLARSFEYGMERTSRRRKELGLGDAEVPLMPSLDAVRPGPK